MKHQICLLVATLVIACAGCAQPPGPGSATMDTAPAGAPVDAPFVDPQEQVRFAEALRLFRSGQWSGAYGRFAQLADQGHVRSARVALQMLRNGPHFYGTQWSAAPSQVVHWAQLAGVATPQLQVAAGE